MLALRSSVSLNPSSAASSSSSPSSCTPNILPCRIHHKGPTKVTKRYWAPTTTTEQDGTATRTSHFRGRRLRGRVVKIPAGYEGVVAEKTAQTLPYEVPDGFGQEIDQRSDSTLGFEEENDREEEEDGECGVENSPPGILEEKARFAEIVVWGHDEVPEKEDAFVKGVEEWVAFAEALHGPALTNGIST